MGVQVVTERYDMDTFRQAASCLLQAGDITDPILLTRNGATVALWPGTGATATVWESASLRSAIEADRQAGLLTQANLVGSQSGLQSRWAKWTQQDVTGAGPWSEGPQDNATKTALMVYATGGTCLVEVSQ